MHVFFFIIFIKFVSFPGSVIFVVRLKTILLPCIGHNMNSFLCHNSIFHLRVFEHWYAFSTYFFATILTSTFVRIYAV